MPVDSIEITSTFSRKFEVLYLILTDGDMCRPKEIEYACSKCYGIYRAAKREEEVPV